MESSALSPFVGEMADDTKADHMSRQPTLMGFGKDDQRGDQTKINEKK